MVQQLNHLVLVHLKQKEILLLIKGALSCVNSTLCVWLHPSSCEEGKSIILILQVRCLRLRDVKYSDQCHTAFLQDWGECARLDTPSSLYLYFSLSFFFVYYLLIYLAVPVLICSRQDLWSLLQYVRFFGCGTWDLAPWPGIKPRAPALGAWSLSHWKVPIAVSLGCLVYTSLWSKHKIRMTSE